MPRPDFPKMEEEILKFWKEQEIFKKTLEKPAPRGNFVFYEGPPTANGKPGIHHVESRAYKDVIPRYKTMQGYRVDRKAGWDTHGLPVELQVEKKLGISGKPQIESLKATREESIAYFNQLCKESVWEYLEDWNALTERIGFWLDLDHPYITYQNEYIESLWWIVKKIHERGLLYHDYKVVPYCARCGTPLSSHELAQGYEEVEDPAVYVKFKLKNPEKIGLTGNVYLFAWTTTPWTLPGNVALAVGERVEYVKIKREIKRSRDQEIKVEYLILAKARLSVLEGEYEVIEEYMGKDLVGWEYEPLYSFVPLEAKAHYVAAADFVSTEEGTGIVHTAVMYGADDFELGKKLGLPKKHLVDLQGKFIPEVKPWAGMFVKDADPLIVQDLKNRNLLYREERIRHTYPFCWRCKTPLLYYAKESWFVKMSALRDELLAANETVNWHPSYIKDGRFGEWLREVKDWAFSRERYWGTPLPIWICDGCQAQKVIGGFSDFPETASGNHYLILRHGESENNVAGTVTRNGESHLTERGREQIAGAIEQLKKSGGIDLIISSPVMRTRETAELVGAALGVSVEVNEGLHEVDFGIFEGKTDFEYNAFWATQRERFERAPEGGETLREVASRMYRTLRDIDARFQGKRILIASHGDPLWMLDGLLRGLSEEGMLAFADQFYIGRGELRPLIFRELPFGSNGIVDPHRPFIDGITFACEKCGETMRRTPEVIDVWFDSGSMPVAQWHYPFEHQEKIDRGEAFPADYISEAIDQTRGWFYTLLAVSTLLGKGAPYRNVICLGHLVDAKGKKMSKTLGNVVDPWEMVNTYGADAVRFFMYTISQPGDTKRFDPQDLDRIVKQTFMILWNVLAFWKLYAGAGVELRIQANYEWKHPLDKWMHSRLNLLVKTVTDELDAYDVTGASRAIAACIDDISTWYVRRSRDRFKEGSGEAVAMLGEVFATLAELMAPFTPFFAEKLYQEMRLNFPPSPGEVGLEGVESVHLRDWPTVGEIDEKLLGNMAVIRKAAELGHAIRAEQGIRVRQPLAEVEIEAPNLKLNDELLAILADELNVKVARLVSHIEEREGHAVRSESGFTVAVATVITLELKKEGWLREIIRQVNELRKESNFTIQDRIVLYYETEVGEIENLISAFGGELCRATLAREVRRGMRGRGKELALDGVAVWLGIDRIQEQ